MPFFIIGTVFHHRHCQMLMGRSVHINRDFFLTFGKNALEYLLYFPYFDIFCLPRVVPMKNIPMKLPLCLLLVPALLLTSLLAQETPSPDRDRPKPIKEIMPEYKKIDGLFTFYRVKDRLLAEIKGNNLNTDYLIAIAVAQGSGSNPIGGFTYQSNGSDWLWQFRKVNDNIQVVRKNIRFKADAGTPEARAVEVGFSDSILYSLPILATGEGGGDVIDLASIFMADLPKLGIGSFDRSRSTWGDVKGFPNNMEFRVAATYSGGFRYGGMIGGSGSSSPEPGVTGVTLHYSISKLPSSGYSPRLADQRVGYFTVSHKNFSRAAADNHNIRYITRWNLQKADPSLALSPPKKAIEFWIEKTVPYKYRNAVREGILEWNKAFEKVGIVGAIEVRQQPDDATWDAEDINYNTIRWITSEVSFAMGPSRVNPLTGEILDADIIIDASWIDYWRDRFDYTIADVLPVDPAKNGDTLFPQRKAPTAFPRQDDDEYQRDSVNSVCTYAQERAVHFALASLALALNEDDENTDKESGEGASDEKPDEKTGVEKPKEENGENKEDAEKPNGEKEEGEKKEEEKKEDDKEVKKSKQELEKERTEKFEQLVLAGLKDLVTHEVGHTLGLRHNFQASSWLTLEEINDPNRSKEFGHAGSVMDYLPINIAPKSKPQGDYFMSGLGPYDYLAIEYGYKILSGSTEGDKKELGKIASRQAEKGNNYATDEDAGNDPRTGTWDLGTNPLEFAQWGLELYNQLLPEILDRAIREDGRYRDVGRYYMLLVRQRSQANYLLMRNLECLYRNKDHKGDPGDRLPIQVVDAKTKRESVQFLCDNTFGADAFKIAPEIYNRFGGESWLSMDSFERTSQVSLIRAITSIQCGTLSDLMSPWVLDALSDMALRVPETDDVYAIDELFNTVTASVFSELDTIKEGEFSSRNPAIPALRRTLQEYCFKLLASHAAGDTTSYSADTNTSRALARQELVKLESKIQAGLTGNAKWDAASSAHLTMLRDRIKKLLEASVTVGRP